MQREAFYDYLYDVVGYEPSTCRSRIGNCSTIEDYEGDLDIAYARDGMSSIIERLQYSKADEREGKPARHSIPINGNVYNGTATLRSAANLYLSFKQGENRQCSSQGITTSASASARAPRARTKKTGEWPVWEQPSREDSRLLAQAAMRYVKFLSPEIVAAIVKDNESRRAEWSESLAVCGVDPSLYLWNGSPCAFPGIRRHAGSWEINRLRDPDSDYSDIQDAICLDDNDYPKQVWSFVFRNAQFSKFGPAGYRLAHLIDHKQHNNRMAEELAIDDELSTPVIPGLYTCPSNTAYVCGGFIHPTDFNADIRNLLQRRAAELYSGVCNMLPPGLSVPEAAADGWKTSDFEWARCVGTLDNMESFIDFRRSRMAKLIKKALESNESNDAKMST